MSQSLSEILAIGMDIGLAAAGQLPEALTAYNIIRACVTDGRDPTEGEWSQISAVSAKIHASVQG